MRGEIPTDARPDRRGAQRDALVEAAERIIAADGLARLKARDLAREIGCSLGAIYNLVSDLDELVLRVGSRTLARLDAALTAAPSARPAAGRDRPEEILVSVALAYCDFARAERHLWRTLFEHRMPGTELPDWSAAEQIGLFRHIAQPLARLAPDAPEEERDMLARTMFSAVHGVVALGLDEKLVGVPVAALEVQVEMLVRIMCNGLADRPIAKAC